MPLLASYTTNIKRRCVPADITIIVMQVINEKSQIFQLECFIFFTEMYNFLLIN
jgi:hypothetical protein